MAPKKNRKRPLPLAPKPTVMKSRKKARKITTLFHKLQKERDAALEKKDQKEISKIDKLLEDMGGREEYQRASQLSTSFHSTSKWVLGSLARRGWLYGIPLDCKTDDTKDKKKRKRRTTRLLEVGAINTELLDASEEATSSSEGTNKKKKYNLHVRAIDIHSMEKRIEEIDFLKLPYSSPDLEERYDVIVCSMVLNCVTTPQDRGRMMAKLYHHLRPNGLLFLTIPLFCLVKSAFLTPEIFLEMLGRDGVGFDVIETKQSPRISFFVCSRPEKEKERRESIPMKLKKHVVRRKGKKFPNQFSVVLDDQEVFNPKEEYKSL